MSKDEYDEWLKHVKTTSRYSVLEPFILHRGEFALSCTLEFIGVPRDLVAHIDGRSSWARQGLKVHSTAGNIHPGSKGFVVFELENVGPVPILLYPGLAIAQLTFDRLDNIAVEDYASRATSKYASFAQNLFSAYPQDYTLAAMRGLLRRKSAQYGIANIPARPIPTDSKILLSNKNELPKFDDRVNADYESILASIEMFDTEDLRIAAVPILAIVGENGDVAVLDRNVSELRKCLNQKMEEAHRINGEVLPIIKKVITALKRERLRGN
jgi:deoxycytidine triphosphate deaminase